MRAGSLSQEPAFSNLRNHFVCGYKNIYKEPFAGNSGVHPVESNAAVTTNGAGPHNLQIFVLSADGSVLHCMPGYWNASDLAAELELGQKLNTVWMDQSITAEQKAALFKKMQLEHLANHSKETAERSHLQGFDAQYIAMHDSQLPELIEKPELLKDYKAHYHQGAKEGEGAHIPYEAFKTTDQIMHERMSKTPFVSYDKFDVAAFTNYGINYYDKNENESEGAPFRPELKKQDLHKLTHDAFQASKSTQAQPAHASVAVDPHKTFLELAGASRFNEAFVCADKVVKASPSRPEGYEMRALAEFALREYENAYSDATRAAWLGCRDVCNAEVRKLAKQAIERKSPRMRVALK